MELTEPAPNRRTLESASLRRFHHTAHMRHQRNTKPGIAKVPDLTSGAHATSELLNYSTNPVVHLKGETSNSLFEVLAAWEVDLQRHIGH